ncbi:hypothetical protein [Tichowtungia aerotolerans]|uniref:Uncharacterized protein n=1 Tax=Tichowtungia aerotolerans TaxID=2697043 RepID=A0A6P1M4I4_9BACT|nr:hypothetical protein [Tichowtungia aerotolerans]QHI68747.1 hypothetical protein GT409_04545 [Tichowtungia aerotolerans]
MKMDINKAKKTIAFLRSKRMSWKTESDLIIAVQATHSLTILTWQMMFYSVMVIMTPLYEISGLWQSLIVVMMTVGVAASIIARKTIKIRDLMLRERAFSLKQIEANQKVELTENPGDDF